MIRLYNPANGSECEVVAEEQAAIYADSGWWRVPEPPEPRPGYAPEPVRYEQGDDGLFRPVDATHPLQKIIDADTAGAVEDVRSLGEKPSRRKPKSTGEEPTEDS